MAVGESNDLRFEILYFIFEIDLTNETSCIPKLSRQEMHLCLSAIICGLCINQRLVQLLVYESGSGTIWDLSFEILD